MNQQQRLVLASVFAGVFLAVSLVNLGAAFLEQERLRKTTKPFCLFALALAALFYLPSEPLIYLGAFFGCAGDIIFLFKEKKICVAIGTVVFLLGHGCYILEVLFHLGFVFEANPLNWLWLALYGVLLLAAVSYPMRKLTNGSRTFSWMGTFYSAVLISDGAAAILGCCYGFSNYLFLMVIGCALFIVSDVTLAFTIFIKDIKRRDFYIMLTYLLGQAFMVSGMLLTFAK